MVDDIPEGSIPAGANHFKDVPAFRNLQLADPELCRYLAGGGAL